MGARNYSTEKLCSWTGYVPPMVNDPQPPPPGDDVTIRKYSPPGAGMASVSLPPAPVLSATSVQDTPGPHVPDSSTRPGFQPAVLLVRVIVLPTCGVGTVKLKTISFSGEAKAPHNVPN